MGKRIRCSPLPLCAVLIVFAASCVPEFENPLPPSDDLSPDPGILGTWVSPGDSVAGDRMMILPRSSGWVDVVLISDVGSDGVDLAIFEGYSSVVGEDRFLCLRERGVESNDDTTRERGLRYVLAYYRITDDDELALASFSYQKIQSLIAAGDLTAEERRQGYDAREVVTSPADTLAALILAKGTGAFIDSTDLETKMLRPRS